MMNTQINYSHLKIPFDNLEIYILSDGYFDIGSYQPIIATDAAPADLQKELNRLHLPTDIYEAPINVMLIRKNEFSDEPIRKWEFALLPGQTPIPLKSKEIYGYGVDAGLGLFVDQAAKNSLNTLLDENWNNMFSEKFEHYLNYSFQNQNAVFFSTGYGDGFYATYIGRDNEGKIVQLLTDFDIVLWRNVAD